MPIRTPASTKKTAKSAPFPLLAVWLIAGVILMAILAVWLGGVPWRKWHAAPQSDTSAVIQKVSRHILVNQDEEPTIATVQDPESLRQTNPDFYKNASVGDRLLIWSDKAVLYSEATDRIVAVLPVSFTPPPEEPSAAATTTAQEAERLDIASIEIRNGTRTPGLAKKLADTMTAAGFKVLKARDAITKGYGKTTLFDKSVSTSTEFLIPRIQNVLGDNVSYVTSTKETGITGDILIIIGTDYIQ